MEILTADPGETTGWAHFIDGELVAQGEIPNGLEGAIEWIRSGQMPRHDSLILESFIVERDFVGRAFASEVIGALALGSRQQGATVLAFQNRGQKATLVRTHGSESARFEWLRSHGFEGSSHELDAITHGLIRLRAEGHRPTVEKYWIREKPPVNQGLSQ